MEDVEKYVRGVMENFRARANELRFDNGEMAIVFAFSPSSWDRLVEAVVKKAKQFVEK